MKQITITQTRPFNGFTRHAETTLKVGPEGDVSETDAAVMVSTGMAEWTGAKAEKKPDTPAAGK